MRSQNARLPPVLAGMAQTSILSSLAIWPANTLKPEPAKCSVTACISIGLRRSGLSEPYLRIAVVIGNARPVLGHRLAVGELLEHAGDHRLHGVPDVFLRDEAHLEVELVELARQAVGARVFVAEARRDLEVAVEARHHQQLLVLLRRLRQREELAGMDAARHEEVARAFRRRRRQDRRRVLGKADARPCRRRIDEITLVRLTMLACSVSRRRSRKR